MRGGYSMGVPCRKRRALITLYRLRERVPSERSE
jgi:hypothetical protein